MLLALAAMQITHVLDFVIVMPLGPNLIQAFGLTPARFGAIVSSYTFSAAAAGIFGAYFVDRFDRRDALRFVYAGFVVGTLACALSNGFVGLLASRALAGAFGGLVQAMVFAIVADKFAEARRGAATGVIMSAFSFASVLGVPLGLWLAQKISWQAPFALIALAGALTLAFAWRATPAMAEHLLPRGQAPGRPKVNRFEAYRFAFSDRNRGRAFWLTIALMFAGFTVIPYMSAFLVANVGVAAGDLHYIYLVGGVCTFASTRWIGRIADRRGKFPTFAGLAAGSAAATVAMTQLPRGTPLAIALVATTAFTVFLSGRSVPAMAMISAAAERSRRASFLTLTSSVQQLSSGAASLLGGCILYQATPSGPIAGYGRAGALAAVATAISIAIAARLRPASESSVSFRAAD